MSTRRFLVSLALLLASSASVAAQDDDARQRQAAAEAYDRGTAAYLGGEYEKAAEWFETAHRMSAAAPALMQAVRSHQRAGQLTRAATLALRLMQEYPEEAAASEYGQSVLTDLSDRYFRVDVVCDCRLDLDDTLQEFHSFFLTPDTPHTLTAHFDTGKREEEISGAAGENRTIRFEPPPPPAEVAGQTPTDATELPEAGVASPEREHDGRKPLPPLVTFIGAGVTVALGAGTVLSLLDRNAKTGDYEDAATRSNECGADSSCSTDMRQELLDDARGLFEDAKSAETRTTVLGIATGVIALSTGAVALFFTDWGGSEGADAGRLAFDLAATPRDATGTVTVRW